MQKTDQIHHGSDNANRSEIQINPSPAPIRHVYRIGLDVDHLYVVAAVRCDNEPISPSRKWSGNYLVAWIKKQVAAGHTVHTVYEACGFGYTLHHALVAAGARSLITTPVRLDCRRSRKNDRLDARELCARLCRYLDGNPKELPVIRIPTVVEQQRRELGRQREFWKKEVFRLENHGRALRLEHEHKTLESGWAGPRKWKEIAPRLSPFVREQLEPVMALIRQAKLQLAALTKQIEDQVKDQKIPKGLGALTLSLLDGEMCDWNRFTHRKAPGSYTGCSPSEYSSGGKQKTGAIDRHGNKHVRTILVEAVYRLIRYRPQWHAVQKLLVRLKAGKVSKKKMVIALARQLSVDLWRWRTGRATLQELGLA